MCVEIIKREQSEIKIETKKVGFAKHFYANDDFTNDICIQVNVYLCTIFASFLQNYIYLIQFHYCKINFYNEKSDQYVCMR